MRARLQVEPPGERAFKTAITQVSRHFSQKMQTQLKFHPKRKWRLDFAWQTQKVAVEIDGGQWCPNGGRHNRDSDRDKINNAVLLGWLVFRFSTQQIKDDPYRCASMVVELLTKCEELHVKNKNT